MGRLAALLLLPCLLAQSSSDWTADSYPNPRTGTGYKQCAMRSVSSVCDPDEILTESERYRLNSELQRLSARTEHQMGTFCQRKGVDAVLAVMRQGSQALANQLTNKWKMDGQCKKSVIFVLSADDRKLYYAGEQNAGIDPSEFQAIVSAQELPLQSGAYNSALVNIFKELGKKTEVDNSVTQPPRGGGQNTAGVAVASLLLAAALAIF